MGKKKNHNTELKEFEQKKPKYINMQPNLHQSVEKQLKDRSKDARQIKITESYMKMWWYMWCTYLYGESRGISPV